MVYLLVCLALAGISLLLLSRSERAASSAAARETELQITLSKAEAQVEELTIANRELQGWLALARARAGKGQEPTADRASVLISALQARSDLLPEPGGSFGPAEEWVVTPHWILAPFQDGLGSGTVVFRYAVGSDETTFTRIDLVRE